MVLLFRNNRDALDRAHRLGIGNPEICFGVLCRRRFSVYPSQTPPNGQVPLPSPFPLRFLVNRLDAAHVRLTKYREAACTSLALSPDTA